MQLASERLVLREFREHDWRALHAIESDPAHVRWQSFDPHTEATAQAYVARVIADAQVTPRVVYDLVITHGSDELCGRVGLRRDADPRCGELWFNIAPRLQGQGLATEALRAMIAYAFGELGMHRVYGDCDPRNPASARVMERAGLRREGHHVQNVFLKGEWCDSLIYALLEHEWRR